MVFHPDFITSIFTALCDSFGRCPLVLIITAFDEEEEQKDEINDSKAAEEAKTTPPQSAEEAKTTPPQSAEEVKTTPPQSAYEAKTPRPTYSIYQDLDKKLCAGLIFLFFYSLCTSTKL